MMNEINKLSKNWQVKKLGEISVEIKPGYPSGQHNSEGKGFLHFRPYNISSLGNIDLSLKKHVPLKSDNYFLLEGDIVFNNTNSPELLGKTCYINKTAGWVFSNHMTRIRVNNELSPKYCALYLHFLFYKGYYRENCANHVNQASISSTFLSKYIDLPFPPFQDQLKIVSKIEELFSELDKGIESLKMAQQQLKKYRQAVLKWAFEGKMTNENVKEGELPEGWKEIKFGDLFSESPQNGIYKPSTAYGSGTLIVRIDGFYNGVILADYNYKRLKVTQEEMKQYQISAGDILINRVNSMPYLGKCGIVKSLKEKTVFESNIMKIKIKKEISLPEFYTMFLSSKKGTIELRKNAKQAVNQASINQTDVSNALVPYCSLAEQLIVVQSIESSLSVIDKMEESINQSLKQAEVLRLSILKRAFEGKLITNN